MTDNYPSSCAACGRSYGVCGYTGAFNSFICNSPNGINTTTDCSFISSYDIGFRNGMQDFTPFFPCQLHPIIFNAWPLYCFDHFVFRGCLDDGFYGLVCGLVLLVT